MKLDYIGSYILARCETGLQIKLSGGYGTASRDLHNTKITTLQHFMILATFQRKQVNPVNKNTNVAKSYVKYAFLNT